jgi:hypothetical protein
LLSRDVFWMVVRQSAIFALSAVLFKALIGLITGIAPAAVELGKEALPTLSR